MTRVVIIGGGPGGYEAALVARQLGAQVTLIEASGVGGSAVLTDVVPSKALIAVAEAATHARTAGPLGVHVDQVQVDLAQVNSRLKKWAVNQSTDIAKRLESEGVTIVDGRGVLSSSSSVTAVLSDGSSQVFEADAILIATGARPRELPTAIPDGERILNWEQLYDLEHMPERLIVVGSGVTGAEFAGAYQALGSQVTLVSSRSQVLPGEDADAAMVIEHVFNKRGMTLLEQSRAERVERTSEGVRVHLVGGEVVDGTHCLMAVGSLPNTDNLGLESVGVDVDENGFIKVDKVSRTNVRGVYAAGDCTGVLMLASVAAMQGRIAMWHVLGDAVSPLNLDTVASNVFTDPEIATVGFSQRQIDSGEIDAKTVMVPLATNARAKMQGITDGFVKLFCWPDTGIVVGGVVVAPKASELILPIALAVENRLTVDQISHTLTVYPSLSGSIAEAALRLHRNAGSAE